MQQFIPNLIAMQQFNSIVMQQFNFQFDCNTTVYYPIRL